MVLVIINLTSCNNFGDVIYPWELSNSNDQVFKMARKGDPTAQTSVGLIYERGLGKEQNLYQAMKWYVRAADQGDPLAAFHIGSLYERGMGVSQNFYYAAKWYKKATAGGSESAMSALAYLYERGLGVEQNFKKAEDLYRSAELKRFSGSELDAGFESQPYRPQMFGYGLIATDFPKSNLGGEPEVSIGKFNGASIEVDLGVIENAN